MSAPLSTDEVLAILKATLHGHGLRARRRNHEGIQAELTSTTARWFFGGRSVTYRMACQLDEETHLVRFRETLFESCWGIPAPFFMAPRPYPHGARAQITREGDAVGTVSVLEYERIRGDLEHAAREAGWSFRFEVGRRP